MIEPVNSRCTIGASDGSSGLTSSVTTGCLPALARCAIRPWPISPPAPVMRTTGLRITTTLPNGRQVDAERRARDPCSLVDRDRAAGLTNDAVDGGQAQPGAAAGFLGREERFEDARLRRLVHADAVVADRRAARSGRARGRSAMVSGAPGAEHDVARSARWMVPPDGIASRALTIRFSSTCSICAGSASTCEHAGRRARAASWTSVPIRRRAIRDTRADRSR